jgi:PAS domain S-box-containing protein
VLSVANARARLLAFVTAWVASTAGIAVALTVGPVSDVTGLRNIWLAVAGAAVFVAFVEAHLMLLTDLRFKASEAAQAELRSRRQAEAELDRTSRLLTLIVNASPVPTQAFDIDGRIILWNPASERVFGWPSDEVVGSRLPVAFTPPEERDAGAGLVRRAIDGGVVNGDRVRRLTRDGTEVWLEIYAGPMIDAAGRTIGFAGQTVDVTDRMAMEAQLRQAAKMEAIGQLSGGIAHDFNNMLTAIRGNAELLQGGLDPERDADLRVEVDEILRAADRAANLTQQLLAFARRAALEPRDLDPTAVIREFAPMLERLIGARVRLVFELAPDTGSVRVDRGQLEQVVLNLAVNARDAMPDGGTLRIATSNDGDWVSGADSVVLTVTDTGVGMDEAVRARIFEPFFTTKEHGKGTGMGLPTVYGIVSMFGGSIDVASEPGRGTTFTIRMPRVAATPTTSAPVSPVDLPGGSETILLIEDEPAVRAFARRSLARLGYTVLEASNDTEAFAQLRSHAGAIDLFLSDIVLPGTPGPALVHQLVGLRPGTPTLLCSGFAPEASMGADPIDPDRFLAKPYTQASLARAVRAAIDA